MCGINGFNPSEHEPIIWHDCDIHPFVKRPNILCLDDFAVTSKDILKKKIMNFPELGTDDIHVEPNAKPGDLSLMINIRFGGSLRY